MHPSLIIPILGVLIPIVVVPTALSLKYAQRVREMEHSERMRALELGRTLPRDEPWWSPARISVAIGAGVPVMSLAIAWMASESLGFRDEIWGIAGAVGGSGVFCGSFLAAKHFNHKARMDAGALFTQTAHPNGKPSFDPDAYDVASSRG